MAARPAALAHLLTLARAVVARRRAWLRYRDGPGSFSEREIEVLGLAFLDDGWRVLVHCRPRRALRILVVDRVVAARGTRARAGRPPPAGLDPAFFWTSQLLDPGTPRARLHCVRLTGALAPVAPALFPTAKCAAAARGARVCRFLASRPAAARRLVESLGPEASLVECARKCPTSRTQRSGGSSRSRPGS